MVWCVCMVKRRFVDLLEKIHKVTYTELMSLCGVFHFNPQYGRMFAENDYLVEIK